MMTLDDGTPLIEMVDQIVSCDWNYLLWSPRNGGELRLRVSPLRDKETFLGGDFGEDGKWSLTASTELPQEFQRFTALLTELRGGERVVRGMRSDESGAWSLAAPMDLPQTFWRYSCFQIVRTPAMLGDAGGRPMVWFADPTVYHRKPVNDAAYRWMLKSAQAAKNGRLKRTEDLVRACSTETGCTSREAIAAWQRLPDENRLSRGRPRNSSA